MFSSFLYFFFVVVFVSSLFLFSAASLVLMWLCYVNAIIVSYTFVTLLLHPCFIYSIIQFLYQWISQLFHICVTQVLHANSDFSFPCYADDMSLLQYLLPWLIWKPFDMSLCHTHVSHPCYITPCHTSLLQSFLKKSLSNFCHTNTTVFIVLVVAVTSLITILLLHQFLFQCCYICYHPLIV